MAAAFGAVLKKHRQAMGFSQEKLAEKASIHPTHVSLIERCERNPSVNVAKSLATALSVSLASIIEEAEKFQIGHLAKHGPGKEGQAREATDKNKNKGRDMEP